MSVLIIINKKKLISLARSSTQNSVGLLTEWSDVFEWLWDFSEWKLAKVGHDWLLGELHELLLSLESISKVIC